MDTATDQTRPPRVPARLGKWANGVWRLTILCPYCGHCHHHGGGAGSAPYGGHRHAHCTDDREGRRHDNGRGYEITLPEEDHDHNNRDRNN